MKNRSRLWLTAMLAVLALLVAACGGEDAAEDTTSSDDEAMTDEMTEPMDDMDDMDDTTEGMDDMTEEDMTEEDMADEDMTEDDMAGGMAMTMGPACEQLPEGDAEGGLEAMSAQPAATAASTNPLLSTLVTAVDAAGLVDTLNSEGPFTIFAPVNEAFEAIPSEDLDALLADTDALTSVLTYHVVAGEVLTSDDLATTDTLTMVNEGDVTVAPTGESFDINGQAEVICANITVGNGIVHLIDGVLMPM